MGDGDSLDVNAWSSGINEIRRKSPPEWYTPRVDRKELRACMKRNNYRAFLSHGLWLLLLVGLGYLGARTFASPWCILVFFLYGTLYSCCGSRWHESLHGTPFKTQFLNDIMYFLGTTMEYRDLVYTHWSHFIHHSFTSDPEVDLEILAPRPVKLRRLLPDFFFLTGFVTFVLPALVLHSLGIPMKRPRAMVPKEELGRMFWSARLTLAIHLAVIALSVVLRSWLPLLLFTLPRFYGGILIFILALTQHVALAEGGNDHRLSTRTVYVNPVFAFLYVQMQYHLEHHLFPNVPFYSLARIHRAVKSQMPPAYRGLLPAFKEMIPAVMRQRHDAAYFIRRPLPDEPASA